LSLRSLGPLQFFSTITSSSFADATCPPNATTVRVIAASAVPRIFLTGFLLRSASAPWWRAVGG
jgi:hypothetical protein